MKIMNERRAWKVASELGITLRGLERHYGVHVVKDDQVKKANWGYADDDGFFYGIDFLLKDHPYCRPFLSLFGIDDWTKIRSGLFVDHVASVFRRVFDARLSFDENDKPPDTSGYCIRTEKECLVAISCRELSDDCDHAQSGTVVHEYGHYVEQRVIPESSFKHSEPYGDRGTSFASAQSLAASLCPDFGDDHHRLIADELVAWMNAVWICWLVGLDPRTAILGAAIDSLDDNTWLTKEVVFSVFEKISVLACSKKHASDYFRRFGGFDLQGRSKAIADSAPDEALCLQIEGATKYAFDQILANRHVT